MIICWLDKRILFEKGVRLVLSQEKKKSVWDGGRFTGIKNTVDSMALREAEIQEQKIHEHAYLHQRWQG